MDLNNDARLRGLSTHIHPLLKGLVDVPEASSNPLKRKSRQFDLTMNPYLENTGSRPKRSLELNDPGKFIRQGNNLRHALQLERHQHQHLQHLGERGLLPDRQLREDLYVQPPPPDLEWWDSFYVNGSIYPRDHNHVVWDNAINPISKYIQHPILEELPLQKYEPREQTLYLTKRELKRKRKNQRQERIRAQQERVRLGLEPPPPPKVKLGNLMNVLTNEAIKDPTAVERQVKQQVQQRLKQHMKANAERQLTKAQKHEKIHHQYQRDIAKGVFRSVYKINQLVDSKHFFKVDKGAQQLELTGLCIVTDTMTLIIVEGGVKSINKYDKLLTNRIDWTESTSYDLSGNKVYKIWQGQVPQTTFIKWSVLKPQTDDDINSVVDRFGIDNVWREACGKIYN